MQSFHPRNKSGVSLACVAENTALSTATGDMPARSVPPGMQLSSDAVSPGTVLRTCRFRADADLLEAHPELKPLRIKAGSVARLQPCADLVLAQAHALPLAQEMARQNGGQAPVLEGIFPEPTDRTLDFVAVLLIESDKIVLNNLPTPTFAPSAATLDALFGLGGYDPKPRRWLRPTTPRDQGRRL
ncbi:MAG: Hint domain-containing protein [Pseudomonadota bacterium]